MSIRHLHPDQFDPETHFPAAVQDIEQTFDVKHSPGGLSVAGTRLPTRYAGIDVHGNGPESMWVQGNYAVPMDDHWSSAYELTLDTAGPDTRFPDDEEMVGAKWRREFPDGLNDPYAIYSQSEDPHEALAELADDVTHWGPGQGQEHLVGRDFRSQPPTLYTLDPSTGEVRDRRREFREY